MVFGYLLARIVIAALFLPAYFRGEMYTAYELMRIRFGDRIRRLTAGTFLLLRALAEGRARGGDLAGHLHRSRSGEDDFHRW